MEIGVLKQTAQEVRDACAERVLCLLSARGTVLACSEEMPPVGTDFFRVYPSRTALTELSSQIALSGREPLLAYCGDRPVLFLTHLFARTGLVLAVLPLGKVASAMSLPLPLSGVLWHLCPADGMRNLQKTPHEEALPIAQTFCDGWRDIAAYDLTLPTLGEYADALSALCGCEIGTYVDGRLLTEKAVDTALLGTVLLACAIAAGSEQKADKLLLCVEKSGAGEIMATLTLRTAHAHAELSEIVKKAGERGEKCHIFTDCENSSLLHVQLSLLPAELSAQGVRNDIEIAGLAKL